MAKPFSEALAAPPGSLTALATIPELRQPYGWWPEYSPLSLVVLWHCCMAAILCGARGLTAIVHWVEEWREDEPAVGVALGATVVRRDVAPGPHAARSRGL